MSIEVMETRAVLDQVVTVDLPELEQAIKEGDYDLALARAAIVRSTRARVRGLLGGADGSGPLRVEWARVEARIDAALVAAPRPNADPAAGRQAWQTQRTARGTDGHARRPRLTSATGMTGRRPPSRTSGLLRAVAAAIGRDVPHPAGAPAPAPRSEVPTRRLKGRPPPRDR
jgi:hypothetical protein